MDRGSLPESPQEILDEPLGVQVGGDCFRRLFQRRRRKRKLGCADCLLKGLANGCHEVYRGDEVGEVWGSLLDSSFEGRDWTSSRKLTQVAEEVVAGVEAEGSGMGFQ